MNDIKHEKLLNRSLNPLLKISKGGIPLLSLPRCCHEIRFVNIIHLFVQKKFDQINLFVNLDKMDTEDNNSPDGNILLKLVSMKMPFGKYKGTTLCYLPVSYLEWFAKKGFPPGQMGMLLATIYEIKINGLEYLLEPMKRK